MEAKLIITIAPRSSIVPLYGRSKFARLRRTSHHPVMTVGTRRTRLPDNTIWIVRFSGVEYMVKDEDVIAIDERDIDLAFRSRR